MFIRFVIVSVFVVALAACTKPVVDHEAEGAALLAPLKKNLKAALIGGMESGPDEAISACAANKDWKRRRCSVPVATTNSVLVTLLLKFWSFGSCASPDCATPC